jgi:uncharacterized protein (AIM24 family)
LSKIALSGNASGSGTLTLSAPNTDTDRTLDLPDAAGTIQVSGNPISGTTGSFSGDLSFNSGYGSAAVAYGCRAWVNFDGSGTVVIRASGNVSSITDNGTGEYGVNFATAMPDANYCTTGSVGKSSGSVSSSNSGVVMINEIAASGNASSKNIMITNLDGTRVDRDNICVAIFR